MLCIRGNKKYTSGICIIGDTNENEVSFKNSIQNKIKNTAGCHFRLRFCRFPADVSAIDRPRGPERLKFMRSSSRTVTVSVYGSFLLPCQKRLMRSGRPFYGTVYKAAVPFAGLRRRSHPYEPYRRFPRRCKNDSPAS